MEAFMASDKYTLQTYVSLLRGINVSGKHLLTMVALKKIYQALGGQQVSTYIQSGNVIFQAACDSTALAKAISQTIQKEFGYIVPVLIHEAAFFSKVVANNPFKDCDPSTLYVTILGYTAHQTQLLSLEEHTIEGTDTFKVQGNVVYVHCPGGYGRTLWNNRFFEAKSSVWATTRNWKTICKLTERAMYLR
jgi:uncharacterized protein (DUF1697 family)